MSPAPRSDHSPSAAVSTGLLWGVTGAGITLVVVAGLGMRFTRDEMPAALETHASFLELHGQGADLVLWSPLLVTLWLAATGRRLPGAAGWVAAAGALIWLAGAVACLPWGSDGGWTFYTPYGASSGWFDEVQRRLIGRAIAHAGLGVAATAVVLSRPPWRSIAIWILAMVGLLGWLCAVLELTALSAGERFDPALGGDPVRLVEWIGLADPVRFVASVVFLVWLHVRALVLRARAEERGAELVLAGGALLLMATGVVIFTLLRSIARLDVHLHDSLIVVSLRHALFAWPLLFALPVALGARRPLRGRFGWGIAVLGVTAAALSVALELKLGTMGMPRRYAIWDEAFGATQLGYTAATVLALLALVGVLCLQLLPRGPDRRHGAA